MKNKTNRNYLGGSFTILSVSLMLMAGVIKIDAAIRTWTGGGNPDFNWSNPANWGGTAPVANDILIFGGTTGLINTNDLTAAQNYAAVSFAASAGAFRIEGNGIKLSVGCTNNSANLQTFNIQVQNNTSVHYWTIGGDIQNVNKLWDWRWYKHGPGTLICASTNTVSGLNGQVLGIDGGLMIFNAQPGAGVIGQGLAINTNGTVRVVGPSTNQIADSRDIYMTGGTFQLQTTNALGLPADEGVATLKGTNTTAIIENGSALGPIGLIIGTGGNDYRGSFSGVIRDGGAGALQLQIRRRAFQVLAGASTYSGMTIITNYTGAGYTRLMVDGSHIGGGAYLVQGSAAGNFAALGGMGIISASTVNISTNGVLSPGGSLSVTATNQDVNTATFSETTAALTVSNAVNLLDVSSTLDIHLNGTTTGSYDQLYVAGSGVFSNNSANLQLTIDIGFIPANGDKFTIVKVDGTSSSKNFGTFSTLNGVPTDLSQGATITLGGSLFKISYRAEGTTFDAGAGNGNDIMLQALQDTSKKLTWLGSGTSSDWDVQTTADWLDTNSVAATFTNLDKVTFNNTGVATNVNLTTDLNPTTLMVDATKDYFFTGAGKLTGAVVITKTNTGTLTLLTANDNVGAAIINKGTLQLGDGVTDGTLLCSVTINSNGVFAINRPSDQVLSGISGSGVLLHKGSGKVTVATDLSSFTGTVSNNVGEFQLGDSTSSGNGAKVGVPVAVASGSTLHHNYNGAADVTIANSMRGNGDAIFEVSVGQARSIITGATVTNTGFTGTTTVKTFTRLSVGSAVAAPAGPIVVEGAQGAYYSHPGSSVTNFNSITIAGPGPGAVSGSVDTPRGKGALRLGNVWAGSITLSANATIGGDGTGTVIGNITDGGNNYVLEYIGSTIQVGPASGVNSYGPTVITEDYFGSFTSPLQTTVRALNSNLFSSSPVTMIGLSRLELNGNNVSIANLIDGTLVTSYGTSNAPVIANGSTTAAATLTLGSDDGSQLFIGRFVNGSTQPLSLTKVGTGTFTVSGDSTNTGTITVQAGTLALAAATGNYPNATPVIGSGSFSNATAIAVATGATLDVSGRSDGTLTLTANNTLKHAGSGTGAITVTGNVNGGNGRLLLAINRSGLAHDSLVASGTFTAGGTLVVTNIGALLQAGDAFELFAGATPGFGNINLPTNDVLNNVKYTWTDTVASDGKITVATVTPLVNTNAPQVQVTVSGNTLKLGWPTNAGWTLLTNSVGLSATSQWFPYPNSANLTNVDITMDPTKTNVFFRMQYPYP